MRGEIWLMRIRPSTSARTSAMQLLEVAPGMGREVASGLRSSIEPSKSNTLAPLSDAENRLAVG